MASKLDEIDHSYTREMVCPHCGDAQSDSWEISGDEVECASCESKFGVERDHDVTYSTFVLPPPKPKEKAGPPDLSYQVREPEAAHRVGEIRIHDARIAVWEESVDDAAMPTVMQGLLGRLYRRGFQLERDPHTLEHYALIADWHWRGRRGDLEVSVERSGRTAHAQFFTGNKYAHNKFACMPRTLQLECIVEVTELAKRLALHGYTLADDLSSHLPLALAVRDALSGRRSADPLTEFNRRWGSCGGRDETGFLSEKEYRRGTDGGRDRDGALMHTGDTRYFYEKGRLMRGSVYPSMNSRWLVLFRGEIVEEIASEFFSNPTGAPRRFVRGQAERLHTELEKALRAKAYARVATLGRVAQCLKKGPPQCLTNKPSEQK